MTVAELLERISSHELSEWMAYFSLEPWGEERADLRAGIVASVVANVNRDPKKRRRPYQPADFMPRFEQEDQEKTPGQLLQVARWLDAAFRGGRR